VVRWYLVLRWEGEMIVMRISMPDRPGMLATVASVLSHEEVDIVTIEVVHRGDGVVVDNLCLEASWQTTPPAIRRKLEAVEGVVVEVVRHVEAPPSSVDAMELAVALGEGPEDPIETLVEGLPKALNAEWAMALAMTGDEVRLLHASPRSPGPPAGQVPWMPLDAPRRLAVAPWMPTSWRLRSMVVGGLEIAASPLGSSHEAVAIARDNGRFRPSEIRQLEILSNLAVRESQLRAPLITSPLLG
jgi:predicted amino acid-binding ACT domain protein